MKIYTLGQVLTDHSSPPPAIVSDGVLLDGTLLMIYGPKKAMKSYLAANLGLAIATGQNFAGFKIVSPRKVLMLSAEGGYYPNRERLQIMAEQVDPKMFENFHVCPDARILLTEAKDVGALKDTLARIQPKVLVMDPLIKFHQADENSAKEMADVMRLIQHIKEDHGLSVILVHHMGKTESAGPRGSSVITGEYDSAIGVTPKAGKHCLSFDMRHVETPPDRVVQFNSATRWFEQEGGINPIASILLSDPSKKFDKKTLVDACVQADMYQKTSAYAAINKAVENGFLEIRDGIYVPKN